MNSRETILLFYFCFMSVLFQLRGHKYFYLLCLFWREKTHLAFSLIIASVFQGSTLVHCTSKCRWSNDCVTEWWFLFMPGLYRNSG